MWSYEASEKRTREAMEELRAAEERIARLNKQNAELEEKLRQRELARAVAERRQVEEADRVKEELERVKNETMDGVKPKKKGMRAESKDDFFERVAERYERGCASKHLRRGDSVPKSDRESEEESRRPEAAAGPAIGDGGPGGRGPGWDPYNRGPRSNKDCVYVVGWPVTITDYAPGQFSELRREAYERDETTVKLKGRDSVRNAGVTVEGPSARAVFRELYEMTKDIVGEAAFECSDLPKFIFTDPDGARDYSPLPEGSRIICGPRETAYREKRQRTVSRGDGAPDGHVRDVWARYNARQAGPRWDDSWWQGQPWDWSPAPWTWWRQDSWEDDGPWHAPRQEPRSSYYEPAACAYRDGANRRGQQRAAGGPKGQSPRRKRSRQRPQRPGGQCPKKKGTQCSTSWVQEQNLWTRTWTGPGRQLKSAGRRSTQECISSKCSASKNSAKPLREM